MTIGPLHSSVHLGKQMTELEGVSKSFEKSKPLVQYFDYIFSRRDRVGIVGPNGCSRTTLLKIIIGKLESDSGSVLVGETVQSGHFGQKLPSYAPDKRVIDIIFDMAGHITDPVTGQSVSATQLPQRSLFTSNRIHTLVPSFSGGGLRRLYLYTVLMASPNLLTLDEPTNDLDITTLDVLESYLSSFEGVLIIVTHDRYFLDKLVEHLFASEKGGHARDLPGNFTQYHLQQEAEVQQVTEQATTRESKSAAPVTSQVTRQGNHKKRRSYREEQEFQQLEQQIPQLEGRIAELERRMSPGSPSNEELIKAGEGIAEAQQEMEQASECQFELAAVEEEA